MHDTCLCVIVYCVYYTTRLYVCVTLQQGDGFGLVKATKEALCGSKWE